jgi:hypothetical protein
MCLKNIFWNFVLPRFINRKFESVKTEFVFIKWVFEMSTSGLSSTYSLLVTYFISTSRCITQLYSLPTNLARSCNTGDYQVPPLPAGNPLDSHPCMVLSLSCNNVLPMPSLLFTSLAECRWCTECWEL